MAKAKGKRVRCDVCGKLIRTKDFKHILVFKADYKAVYFHESCSECEMHMDVCNSCAENLNFREYEK